MACSGDDIGDGTARGAVISRRPSSASGVMPWPRSGSICMHLRLHGGVPRSKCRPRAASRSTLPSITSPRRETTSAIASTACRIGANLPPGIASRSEAVAACSSASRPRSASQHARQTPHTLADVGRTATAVDRSSAPTSGWVTSHAEQTMQDLTRVESALSQWSPAARKNVRSTECRIVRRD